MREQDVPAAAREVAQVHLAASVAVRDLPDLVDLHMYGYQWCL
jgi:hypothetical protein